MLVLLPPSEGKAAPRRRGRPVDFPTLSFPELAADREQLLDLLAHTSARPDAGQLLGVGASLAHEVAANVHLHRSPAMPAAQVFTGVLYDALGLATLDPAARRRAGRQLVVMSALWGALRPGDRIPPYRLSIGAELPSAGPLAAWWRPRLGPSLTAAAGDGLVLDCRSAGYAAMWSPVGKQAERWVSVRVFRDLSGQRTVVSHLAKLTRGQLVRHLLQTGVPVRTPARLADVARSAFEVELSEPERPGRPWHLDVVLREG